MAEGITTTTGGPSKKRWNKKNNGNKPKVQETKFTGGHVLMLNNYFDCTG